MGNERILYMVVAMRYIGRVVLLIKCFICYTCICVFGTFLYVFFLLAHPICLCLAMIVYALHVSR